MDDYAGRGVPTFGPPIEPGGMGTPGTEESWTKRWLDSLRPDVHGMVWTTKGELGQWTAAVRREIEAEATRAERERLRKVFDKAFSKHPTGRILDWEVMQLLDGES